MTLTQEINGKLYGVNESSGDFYDLNTGRPISRHTAYTAKAPAIPRNTFYDDEPSFITPRESNQFWTKRNPLTIAPPSPHQIRESANLAQIGAPGAMLAQLPEGAINPFVRSPSPQSSIFSGGKYSNSPLNRIANLNTNSPSNRENNMANTPPILRETGPTQRQIDLAKAAQLEREALQRQAPIIPSIPQPTINQPVVNPMPAGYNYQGQGGTRFDDAAGQRFWNNRQGTLDRSAMHVPYSDNKTNMATEGISDMSNPFGNKLGQYQQMWAAGPTSNSGVLAENAGDLNAYENALYGGNAGKGIDYLGWANVGTGVLKGLGSLASGYAAIKNLGLTRDAFEQQSAMGWKNLANQEAVYNQNIGSKKHFIEKTHADPTSPHLKYI